MNNKFFVRIINTVNEFVDTINEISSMIWTYDSFGGCGKFNLTVPKGNAIKVSGEYEVQIVEITDEEFINNKYGANRYGASKSLGYSIPILHYRCEDNAASITVDDATGNYDGTLQSGGGNLNTEDATTGGKIDNGFALDGSDDHIDAGDVTELNSATAFTLAGWFTQNVLDAADTLFAKDDGNDAITLITTASGNMEFTISTAGADFTGSFDYSANVTAKTWFHVAVVVDLTQSTDATRVKLYINNTQMTLSFSGTAPANTPNLSSDNLLISSSTNALSGNIDDIRVYDKAISEFQITAIYNNDSGIAGTNQSSQKYGASNGEKIWYTGYVQIIKIDDSDSANIQIIGSGFRDKLDRVIIDETFTNQDITEILSSILTSITSQVDIGTGTIETTGFTVDELVFDNEGSDKVVQKLVDLAGDFEWGVDRSKNLYFVQKDTAINFRVYKGVNVILFENEEDFEKIKNSILVVGGKLDDDTIFSQTTESSDSITNFGKRQRIIQNSSVVTASVATQLANSILSNAAIPEQRGDVSINPGRRLFEENVPLGRMAVMDGEVAAKYATIKYGTSNKYGGAFPYNIENIIYTWQGEQLFVSVQLGQPLTSLTNKIAQLEFDVEQQRQNQ